MNGVLHPCPSEQKEGRLQEATITSVLQGRANMPTSPCPTYSEKVNYASQVSAQKRNFSSGQASC